MSTLTKIFVVLLVILSIVMTAGTVVWVNRSANFTKTISDQKAKLDAAKADATSAEAQYKFAMDAKTQLQQQMQSQINAKQQEIDALHATVTDRETQVAQLTGNLGQVTAAQKSANDALTVAQKTIDQQNGAIAELRKADLELQKRVGEQSFAISDWTNKYEVANRQWRDAEEQVTQLQGDNKSLRETMHKAGLAENSTRTVNGEPLVRVEGVVRSKDVISGVTYATISVVAADQVTKGMQFKVIDPQSSNPFLGYLIVDRVEPNEAIGHLTGPRVNEVHPGVEVRTQL